MVASGSRLFLYDVARPDWCEFELGDPMPSWAGRKDTARFILLKKFCGESFATSHGMAVSWLKNQANVV